VPVDARLPGTDAPRAQSQIDEVTAWWRANRPAAANLVADELEAAVDRLASAPFSGTVYRRVEFRSVRRALLPRIRYHAYYEVDEAKQLVRIVAFWHASRRSGPRL
jgi:plasmid stabilization system protein ParE